ncbi:hypothetical protein DPM33_16960 [Mesorhizobium hawassense]|uniref:Uncharacterized protein n=1 Tax=Mesorhizobium hawassense TaxID=1209954 RepID=A0A330HSR4_9HYPH|nr:hypothetical protein [Mesorhizobium hawassense]RAZ89864.1 hypothetical protein DPM33_16960 [Mesorhizobium hawassense]
MGTIRRRVDDCTTEPDMDDRKLDDLTDRQPDQKANEWAAAQAVICEFEAEWYGQAEVSPLATER